MLLYRLGVDGVGKLISPGCCKRNARREIEMIEEPIRTARWL